MLIFVTSLQQSSNNYSRIYMRQPTANVKGNSGSRAIIMVKGKRRNCKQVGTSTSLNLYKLKFLQCKDFSHQNRRCFLIVDTVYHILQKQQ